VGFSSTKAKSKLETQRKQNAFFIYPKNEIVRRKVLGIKASKFAINHI